MNRFRSLALVWPVILVVAGCSNSNPASPSLVTGDPGLVILPYTGGPVPTSSGATTFKAKVEQLEGRLDGFPSTPSGSFTVDGRTVTTNSSTSFVRGNSAASFADLAVGQRVHVTGQATPTGVLASLVRIQNTEVDVPVVLNGRMTTFTGAASTFAFKVDEKWVRGDAATEFFGGSAFADLGNDAQVNVKGLQRDGFVYAQRIHVEPGTIDPTPGSTPDPTPDPIPDPIPDPVPDPVPPPTPVAAVNPNPIQGLAQCQMYTCGFLFTVNSDMSVVALGQWDENVDGLPMNASVGLWSTDGVLLASVVVPSGTSAILDGAYRYMAITPVTLVAGRQYVIGSAFAGGGAPTVLAASAVASLTPVNGRLVFKSSGLLSYPTGGHPNLFAGGNFLFVPPTP